MFLWEVLEKKLETCADRLLVGKFVAGQKAATTIWKRRSS